MQFSVEVDGVIWGQERALLRGKPEGQPAKLQIREPEPVNILTALAENESVVKNQNEVERKGIALNGSSA